MRWVLWDDSSLVIIGLLVRVWVLLGVLVLLCVLVIWLWLMVLIVFSIFVVFLCVLEILFSGLEWCMSVVLIGMLRVLFWR